MIVLQKCFLLVEILTRKRVLFGRPTSGKSTISMVYPNRTWKCVTVGNPCELTMCYSVVVRKMDLHFQFYNHDIINKFFTHGNPCETIMSCSGVQQAVNLHYQFYVIGFFYNSGTWFLFYVRCTVVTGARVAQWLEALTGNHRIESSNPTGAKEFVLCS